ncbi:MAG: HvfC/BufC family peptide modification chaperone [Thiotrichales bacterium]
MNLQTLQTSFQHAVLETECIGADWVSSSKQGMSSQARLAIYHNAYRLRLIDVLLDTYEHTATYLGDDWFQALASRFVQSHSSTHDNIGYYGQAFPSFLAEQLPDDLEVAEMAQMDWTLRRAFDGADCEVMTLDHLHQIISGHLAVERLQPVPTLSLSQQQFNTLDIWHAINQDETPPNTARLPQTMDIVIWRKEYSPHFQSISPIEALAIRCLRAGETLENIGATLAKAFPESNPATTFGGFLQRWINEQMLAAPIQS